MTLRLPLLVLATVLLSVSGCDFEDFDGPYDGDPVMEFNQVNSAGPYTFDASQGDTLVFQTNLIGDQFSSPKTLSFTVKDNSTAVEGTHYRLPNGTQYELPANSSFGNIEVIILDAGLAPGARRLLLLELQGATDGSIGAAENLDDMTIRINGPKAP